MGFIYTDIRISNPTGDLERTIEALVDTGSLYTTVPTSLLEEIGTERLRQVRFELADGSVMETDIGVAVVAIDGHEVATFVAFGADGVEPLLGAMSLQQLELAVDMKNERLVEGHRIRM